MIVAGILSPLEDVLRHILDWLGPHGSIGLPWAWSIVALTIIVRMLLVPLTVRQIHSMQRLQAIAPQLKEIQKKYAQDKRKQQEELMKFYRENDVNPAASCLPMLAQIPVFIALYFVLRHFHAQPGDNLSWLGLVDITHKANTGWGPLLIAVYVLSQISSSFFMSTTAPTSQRVMLLVLPVFFVPFIIRFPMGLVLYWVTTNLWTVGQGLITRRLVPKQPPPPKRTSRAPARAEAQPDGAKRAEATKPAAASKASAEAAPPAAPAPRRVKRKKKKGGARR